MKSQIPEIGTLTVASKFDRTNTLEWTASNDVSDSYGVYWSADKLPIVDDEQGRIPHSACGAESGMQLLGTVNTETPGAKLNFDVQNITGIQTVVVVATRAGGYKGASNFMYVTVEGGPDFVPGSNGAPPVEQPAGGDNMPTSATQLAMSSIVLLVGIIAVK